MTIYSVQSAMQSLMDTILSAETRKPFIGITFLSLAAIFTGFFFGICLPDTDSTTLIDPVAKHLSSSALPLSSLIANSTFLLILFLSGYLFFGVILSLPLLLLRFFAFGFCSCLFLLSDITSGIFSAVFLLSHAFLVPVFILAEIISIGQNTGIPSRSSEYHFLYILLACLVILASLIQLLPVLA